MNVHIKRMRIRYIVIVLMYASIGVELFSQEFKHETGSAVGTSFYLGDANRTKLFFHSGAAGGGIYRYNFNLQWTLKATFLGGVISGDTKDSGNRFPGYQQESFKRSLADVGIQAEFHFFRYSDGYGYLDVKPYTPYLFAGAGVTFAGGEKPFVGLNVPLGVGFKYKLNNRMNVGAEFSMRKLFRDDLDVTEHTSEWSLNAPFGIESSFLKNQDWYSFALIYLTWNFGLRETPCH